MMRHADFLDAEEEQADDESMDASGHVDCAAKLEHCKGGGVLTATHCNQQHQICLKHVKAANAREATAMDAAVAPASEAATEPPSAHDEQPEAPSSRTMWGSEILPESELEIRHVQSLRAFDDSGDCQAQLKSCKKLEVSPPASEAHPSSLQCYAKFELCDRRQVKLDQQAEDAQTEGGGQQARRVVYGIKSSVASEDAATEARMVPIRAREAGERAAALNTADESQELSERSLWATANCDAKLEQCRAQIAQTPKEKRSETPHAVCQEKHQECLLRAKATAERDEKALEHAKAAAEGQARRRVKAKEDAEAQAKAEREDCDKKLESCKAWPWPRLSTVCKDVHAVCTKHADAKAQLEALRRETDAAKEAVANNEAFSSVLTPGLASAEAATTAYANAVASSSLPPQWAADRVHDRLEPKPPQQQQQQQQQQIQPSPAPNNEEQPPPPHRDRSQQEPAGRQQDQEQEQAADPPQQQKPQQQKDVLDAKPWLDGHVDCAAKLERCRAGGVLTAVQCNDQLEKCIKSVKATMVREVREMPQAIAPQP